MLVGQEVIYIPTNQVGIVTSIGDKFVFVNFDTPYRETGQACRIQDLKIKPE